MKVYIANGQTFTDKKEAKRHTIKGEKVIKRKIPDFDIKPGGLVAINGELHEVVGFDTADVLAGHTAVVFKVMSSFPKAAA